jgi:hypothetical protein
MMILFRPFKNWLYLILVLLFAILSTMACAQDRQEEDATQIENQDKEAAKRARKAERKSRKDKKDSKSSSIKLPPPPNTPTEFDFFDGTIFSRKVNLGIKNVLCFASERRPLAVLWREMGQEGSAAANGSLPIQLSARELQIIFGRTIDAAQISVLNENGEMLARGVASQVDFNLGRRPIYLLVEITPSRPKPDHSAKK